jgi:hypothetical protein
MYDLMYIIYTSLNGTTIDLGEYEIQHWATIEGLTAHECKVEERASNHKDHTYIDDVDGKLKMGVWLCRPQATIID